MEDLLGDYDCEDVVQVIDINNLQRNFHVEDELRMLGMTSLGTLMLLVVKTEMRYIMDNQKDRLKFAAASTWLIQDVVEEKNLFVIQRSRLKLLNADLGPIQPPLFKDNDKTQPSEQAASRCPQPQDRIDDDTCLQRLSLAYERLSSMPKIILQEIAPHVKILDISHNEFDNLDFLAEFKELTSLICDHNKISSKTRIPFMPKLELLWMNHCKVTQLYPWARMLQHSCPNLKYLSLMGNSISPYYINGGYLVEYIHYRLFLISLFPKLVHLDERAVTIQDRQSAKAMYPRPLMEKIVSRTQQKLPEYLRVFAEKVTDLVTPTPGIFQAESKRNDII